MPCRVLFSLGCRTARCALGSRTPKYCRTQSRLRLVFPPSAPPRAPPPTRSNSIASASSTTSTPVSVGGGGELPNPRLAQAPQHPPQKPRGSPFPQLHRLSSAAEEIGRIPSARAAAGSFKGLAGVS
uniref:Uncharacterized protein n=1 Tax=Oryza barthii TaxID=65489 RepID=A0A0D3HS91_9ORYZ